MSNFDTMTASLAPVRGRLLRHPLYTSIDSAACLRTFMEHHVFCVWDFMSLVKSLQRRLTCVDVPWTPRGDSASRRFVNEIVLGEESDADGEGGFVSHFELYLAAMRQAGARTDRIDALIGALDGRATVEEALEASRPPPAAAAFVRSTFRLIASGSLPAIAAAFTLGREDVIPEMFRTLVAHLDASSPGQFALVRRYFERHVDLDETTHAPMARQLLGSVCGDDADRWREAGEAAASAIVARVHLWDEVHAAVRATSPARPAPAAFDRSDGPPPRDERALRARPIA